MRIGVGIGLQNLRLGVPAGDAPVVPLTATLTADPASIQQGQSTTLTWTTTGASAVTLDGAPVAAAGSTQDAPAATTTYTLAAQSAGGGSVTSTATVTVIVPLVFSTATELWSTAASVWSAA